MLWGTDNQPVILAAIGIVGVAAVLSVASYIYAARIARDRAQKVAAGMRLRGAARREIRRERRAALKVRDTDYDFMPGWITYLGMTLALASVLILAYALVLRFLA